MIVEKKMIVLSDYRENDFCVRFTITIGNEDPFTLRSDYIESDPMVHIQDFIEYIDLLLFVNQDIEVKVFEEDGVDTVSMLGVNCNITYTESELGDSCVAEIFTTNMYELLSGIGEGI